jgi:hypothetical protein
MLLKLKDSPFGTSVKNLGGLWNNDDYSKLTKVAVLPIYGLLLLIAAPAWAIETLYDCFRKSSEWEFRAHSGTLYILIIVFAGIWMLVLPQPALNWIGLFFLFEVEVLGIAVAASVPLGKWKAYHARYLGLAGRRFSHERNANIIDPGSIYLAVLSYIYNAFFLGAVAYFVSVLGAHAFTNAPTETGLDALRIYVFSSFVWVLTLGFTEMMPASPLGRILCLTAFGSAVLFSLLIFSLIIDRLIKFRTGHDKASS